MSEDKSLIVDVSSFGKIKFSIGSEEKVVTIQTTSEIVQMLNDAIEHYSYWSRYIDYYKDFSLEKIEEILKQEESHFEEDHNNYDVGENFAAFLQLKSESGRFADNNEAIKIIEKDWVAEFGKSHSLDFSSEMSMCCIYTSDREEAKKFIWWSYNKYIKPVLDSFTKG